MMSRCDFKLTKKGLRRIELESLREDNRRLQKTVNELSNENDRLWKIIITNYLDRKEPSSEDYKVTC